MFDYTARRKDAIYLSHVMLTISYSLADLEFIDLRFSLEIATASVTIDVMAK